MSYVKDIYLVRHGETDCNRMGIVQGRGVNAPLNELGIRQAAAFFRRYHQIPFDMIYTSLLQRTAQTVAPFTNLGIPSEAYGGLDEISWGDFEGKFVSHSDRLGFHDMVARWRGGEVHLAIDGGESPLDVVMRQKPVIDLILSREDERNILICSHGRAMKILLTQLMDKPLAQMDSYSHQNLGLYHIRLNVEGALHLEKQNCVLHLQPA
ncbi:MAG: histidine phosphatase family protein [Bacteroidota bacterium]|nr:histidine phosphatase family protein [Bacteroidota bacterium]